MSMPELERKILFDYVWSSDAERDDAMDRQRAFEKKKKPHITNHAFEKLWYTTTTLEERAKSSQKGRLIKAK